MKVDDIIVADSQIQISLQQRSVHIIGNSSYSHMRELQMHSAAI